MTDGTQNRSVSGGGASYAPEAFRSRARRRAERNGDVLVVPPQRENAGTT
jgi:hypothetical protein